MRVLRRDKLVPGLARVVANQRLQLRVTGGGGQTQAGSGRSATMMPSGCGGLSAPPVTCCCHCERWGGRGRIGAGRMVSPIWCTNSVLLPPNNSPREQPPLREPCLPAHWRCWAAACEWTTLSTCEWPTDKQQLNSAHTGTTSAMLLPLSTCRPRPGPGLGVGLLHVSGQTTQVFCLTDKQQLDTKQAGTTSAGSPDPLPSAQLLLGQDCD